MLALLAAALSVPPEIEHVLHAQDAFEILGVGRNAVDARAVRRSHRRLALAIHPDKFCSDRDETSCNAAARASIMLNNARDELLRLADHQHIFGPADAGLRSAGNTSTMLVVCIIIIIGIGVHKARAGSGWRTSRYRKPRPQRAPPRSRSAYSMPHFAPLRRI